MAVVLVVSSTAKMAACIVEQYATLSIGANTADLGSVSASMHEISLAIAITVPSVAELAAPLRAIGQASQINPLVLQ